MPEDDNKTPYLSEVFDDHITKTIPFYYLFHQETIKFIRSLPLPAKHLVGHRLRHWDPREYGVGGVSQN